MKIGFILILLSWCLVESKRDGNQRFKTCCARQKDADKSCKRKFCDFNSLSQNNVIF